ncbi:MAG: peptidoglycan editing factor PgeF [Mycobacteriales bacterium]
MGEALELVPAGLPAAAGGFTTRTGGVSAEPYATFNLGHHVADEPDRVQTNRARLADRLRLGAGGGQHALIFAQQVHGRGVAVVSGPTRDPVAGVDALVTATPGLGLVVLAADCLPVLLVDPVAGVVAAAHAGRRGLAAGVLQATVTAMAGLGTTAAGTTAVLGPAACGRCYELPAALADEVDRAAPGARATTRAGTASVDLQAGAITVLHAAGITAIRTVGGCTMEQPDRFFSYRRDGVTGRHGAVVALA